MRAPVSVALLAICCAFQPAVSAYRVVNRKSAYMAKAAAALRVQLNTADVRLINDTIKVLFPKNLMFDFGQAGVRPDFMPSLERFSRVLNEYSHTDILLIGHTDGIGNADRNAVLSRRRADSTRNVLSSYGVADARINAWGIGAGMPLAGNGTEAGRRLNRRVEFVVLYNFADH